MPKLTVDIACPKCAHKFKYKVEDMKPGSSTKCPSCHAGISFTGQDMSRVQKAFDDLNRTLKRTFKI